MVSEKPPVWVKQCRSSKGSSTCAMEQKSIRSIAGVEAAVIRLVARETKRKTTPGEDQTNLCFDTYPGELAMKWPWGDSKICILVEFAAGFLPGLSSRMVCNFRIWECHSTN